MDHSRPMLGFVCNAPEEPCSMPDWCSTCPGHVGGRRHGKKRSRNRRRRYRRSRAHYDVEGWCEICQWHHPKHRPRKHGVRRRSHFLRDNSHVLQVTSREYRHMSRVEHHAFWFEDLKKRYPRYGAFLKDMSSFKTSSSASLLSRYEHIWKNINAMLEFCALKGFRKWRFTLSRFKRKAVAKLAKRVVPNVDRDVCVALGKWSSQTHLAGHMHVPLKRFALELSRRATLIMVDEFRTSYLCSECSRLMVDTPLKIYGTTKTKRSRNVRVCRNVACAANYWERDINAAKNLWQLGLLQVTHRPRTPQFCRGHRIN